MPPHSYRASTCTCVLMPTQNARTFRLLARITVLILPVPGTLQVTRLPGRTTSTTWYRSYGHTVYSEYSECVKSDYRIVPGTDDTKTATVLVQVASPTCTTMPRTRSTRTSTF